MKIIELKSENVKRLSAVTIRPDGNLVIIGGNNGEGKSSCLDSIMYALAGGKTIPDVPIRRGESKAQIVVDLDDIVVRRSFSAKGNYLTVEGKDGTRFNSGQAVLDKLTGSLSFDPLEFSRMDAKKQAATLRQLVGLDFTDLDDRRAALYAERTNVNRDLNSAEANYRAAPFHRDAPTAEFVVAELLKELGSAQEAEAEYQRGANCLAADMAATKRLEATVVELEEKLGSARRSLADARESEQKTRDKVASINRIDLAPIQQKLAGAETINRQVRENAQHRVLRSRYDTLSAESGRLTTSIDDVDKEKKEMLASAKFPVDGLAFDDGGVTLNGLPFSQASSAEQLRVSVAMGLALNPKLRVLLVRDGSLLDPASLAMIAEMAAKADAQIWIEKVSLGEECSVIIEDGMVRDEAQETAAATA